MIRELTEENRILKAQLDVDDGQNPEAVRKLEDDMEANRKTLIEMQKLPTEK